MLGHSPVSTSGINPTARTAVRSKSLARDGYVAAENLVLQLVASEKLARVLAPAKLRKAGGDFDLSHPGTVAIVRPDIGEPFEVSGSALRRLHPEVISLDLEKRGVIGAQLFRDSPSFASLIESYGAATQVTQKGDSEALFRTLSVFASVVLTLQTSTSPELPLKCWP